MEQVRTTRQPRINVGTQTWDTIICRNCIETRSWLESPLIQELQQYRHSPVAILSRTELVLLQQSANELRRQFLEHEQTHERRMDHEEIFKLRQRRTLLEAKLRTNYRELRAAKENIKILQMIIIKLERHRRAVIEAVKLDALLPSTCLSSVITDEEQWIVRRIVSRFLTKAAKTDLIKVTDPSAVSPPSSVCSRQNADIDSALQAQANSKVISQSSLIWPSQEISEASIETINTEEANRRYELAEMMVEEEQAAKANNLKKQSKSSNTSIHILLPAGSSVCIAETKEETNADKVTTSTKSCEIVYVSPVCTPLRKVSETIVVKEKSSKVEFTPITSAHLLFHTEEGVQKVNPFLEALKKISSDLAKFALPIRQSNERAIDLKDVEESQIGENYESSRTSGDENRSGGDLELVYLSPVLSPVQGSSTTMQDSSSTQVGLDKSSFKTREKSSELEIVKNNGGMSYPILSALEKISNDIDFYTRPPCNKTCHKHQKSSTAEAAQLKIPIDDSAGESPPTSRYMESQRNSDTYSCRMSKRYMCVLDIPCRKMTEPRYVIEPPKHEPDLGVLSQGILRNLATSPRQPPKNKPLLGKEVDPSDFFDQFS